MAVVLPFRALRYDQAKVGSLERVLTQPYDKITPEMQRAYLQRSPYNLVQLVKGETLPQDSATDNVYTRAAQKLRAWRAEGILKQSASPSFYAYFQRFSSPQNEGGPVLTRKGFIGLGRLEQYDAGVVFRHEQTLSAPKADRLELLRATRAHLESIMMLYSDPGRSIEQHLDRVAQGPASVQVQDEYGVQHSLWEIAEPAEVAALQQAMADKKLIIADGHHRYETALTFERECRALHAPSATAPPQGLSGPAAPDCSFALMTYLNTESDGIVILPTHRLLSGLPGWNREGFLERAARYFLLTRFPFGDAPGRERALREMRHAMEEAGREQSGAPVFGALFQGEPAFYTLRTRSDVAVNPQLADLTPAQRSLDVNILHRVALGLCLGVDEESVRQEHYIRYLRQVGECVDPVLAGAAQACFLLNPVRIEQVREIAFAGQVLPQKSTDFYPKLLSGLAMYTLDH